MPFGMGPAGWFVWPWFAGWLYWWWYPWYRFFWPYPPLSKDQEMAVLEERARFLRGELERVEARLKELRGEK